MHVRRWLRRLIPRCDDPLRSLALVCGPWRFLVDSTPPNLPDGTEPTQNAIEPPPGHPERLTEHRPLSAAERELWAALDLDFRGFS